MHRGLVPPVARHGPGGLGSDRASLPPAMPGRLKHPIGDGKGRTAQV